MFNKIKFAKNVITEFKSSFSKKTASESYIKANARAEQIYINALNKDYAQLIKLKTKKLALLEEQNVILRKIIEYKNLIAEKEYCE
jgi:hypothetical protein